jgi:hypothetical protein
LTVCSNNHAQDLYKRTEAEIPVVHLKHVCRVVSTLHAALAFAQGVYWLKASGELQQLGNRPFLFAPVNAHIASIGASYFFYDCIAMVLSYHTMKPGFFWTIMLHHFIFVAAYITTLVNTPTHAVAGIT